MIKVESLVLNKEYAFSFNPEEQPLFEKFYKCKLNNLSDWSNAVKERLLSLKYAKVEVYTEISQKGRFHFHGYIRIISDIVKFVVHDLAKLRHYGTYEIDDIKDPITWQTYVHKQEHIMKNYCHSNNMSYMISNIE